MNKKHLNEISTHPLQTSYWGEFREEWGNEVLYTKYGLITVHRTPITRHKIATLLKGPKPTKKILTDLKKIAKENNLIFIKLEPSEPAVIARSETTKQSNRPKGRRASLSMTKKQKVIINLLKENGCVPGKTLFTPTTFWIDLTKSEEELMKGFKSKTRYNVRYAKRKGVKVEEDNSDRAFERYLELTRKTVERQGFYAHTEKYHRLMWKHLNKFPISNGQSPIARLLVAKHKDEILVAWTVFVWKNFLYYPYGASSTKHQNRQSSSLMMWEAIRYGKRLGLKTFDLWGREPGEGFTRFKEGFNPQVVEFLGTWDLATHPLYRPYRIAEKIRWSALRMKSKFTSPKF